MSASPQKTRINGEPPEPIEDEPTEPNIPPPSLKDGSPDWDAFEQAQKKRGKN